MKMSAGDSNRGKRREQERENRRIAQEAARVAATIKTAEEEKEPPKKHRVVTRRKIKVEKDPEPVQDKRHNNGREQKNGNWKQHQNGNLFPLRKIAEGPSTRTSANGNAHDRNYTVITRHLFNFNGTKEFKTMFFIPEDAEVVLVPKNRDTLAHFRVPMGDAFIYISTDFGEVKPGMSVEGWAELKVKAVKRPSVGPRSGFYPYANIWRPLEKDQLPEFILELDSEKWFVANKNFAFTPASGKEKTILHMNKIDSAIKIIKE